MSSFSLRTMPYSPSVSQAARLIVACLVALSVSMGVSQAQQQAPAWIEVDYGPVLERSQLSHSGETVEELVARLGSASSDAERNAALELLEPLVEPYAFLLPDAIETLSGAPETPFVELAMLWDEGEAQPAWVELARARRYVIESDGAGTMRFFVPAEGPSGAELPTTGSVAAARSAWDAHYGVLRHALASELARRGDAGLKVLVHPYRHVPERSLFQVGTSALELEIEDALPRGTRPPLDLASWRAFLEGGLVLEGARLTREGQVLLLGSRTDTPPEMLGRPVELSDFAAAYRAVFHGGMAAPYMSLDQSPWPHRSLVSYGGRLKDTMIGLVTLLCDVRFKTFSQGLDPFTDSDERARLEAKAPDFLTHIESRALDPRGLQSGVQTRFWFYPDAVDLTLSVEGDVLVFRRARMSAASERVSGSATNEAPPWTQRTIDGINRNYEALAELYPEMASLDHVVRLLSLFTWLREIQAAGAPLPELDALLGVELPALRTPRTFPQQLAFVAIPTDPSTGPVAVHGQGKVGRALHRLVPRDGRRLEESRRAARALEMLDRSKPSHAQAAQGLESVNASTSASDRLRLLYRADFEVMYRFVLGTLDSETKATLSARARSGERFVARGLGLGGLDLRMGQALQRARGRAAALAWGRGAIAGSALEASSEAAPPRSTPANASRGPASARAAWRVESPGLVREPLPPHAWPVLSGTTPATLVRGTLALQRGQAGDRAWSHALAGPLAATPRSRRVSWAAKGRDLLSIERVEGARLLSYALERSGIRMAPAPRPPALPEPLREGASGDLAGALPDAPAQAGIPEGLVELELVSGRGSAPVLGFEARRRDGAPQRLDESRDALRRLVLGRELEIAGAEGVPAGVTRLVGPLEGASRVMFRMPAKALAPAWEDREPARPGEEDAMRLAGALNGYWSSLGALAPDARALVGIGGGAAQRWERAPRVPVEAMLLLAEDAFGEQTQGLRAELERSWTAGPVVSSLPERGVPDLVFVVSAEGGESLGARLSALAGAPALEGKHLVLLPLEANPSPDAAARLIARGLVGVGLIELEPQRGAHYADLLGQLADAVRNARGEERRVEDLHPAIVWHY